MPGTSITAPANNSLLRYDSTKRHVDYVEGAKIDASGNITAVGATFTGDVDLSGADVSMPGLSRELEASAVIASTDAETDFDKDRDIAANTLAAGDRIDIIACGTVLDVNATPNLTIKLYLGSTVIYTSGAVAAVQNDTFEIRATVIVRSIGATGSVVAMAIGNDTNDGALGKTTVIGSLNTTAAIKIKVSAEWSASDASNQARLETIVADIT